MATPIPENQASFTLSEVLTATSGVVVSAPAEDALAVGVSTDTRQTLAGKIFVALRGERFDGHTYLESALRAGAQILLVEKGPEVTGLTESEGFRAACSRNQVPPVIVVVSDTLVALGALARFHRMRLEAQVIAVVGSAGKTTTRSAISAILSAARPEQVHSTVGNLNNRIGVPMVILAARPEHKYLVLELGTNCEGEIAALGHIARPDLAVMTLIDLEHTAGLGGLDGVEQEERAIFDYLTPSGVALGYGEDARVLRSVKAAPGARQLSYGFESERDLQISERALVSETLSRIVLQRGDGSSLSVVSHLVGKPGALAVAASVLTVETILGERLNSDLCESALRLAGEPGRNTVVSLGDSRWLIDDTYNSNPASVKSSVATGRELSEQTGGHLWLVLGEMLELGELSKESHRLMGEVAATSGAAGAFFIQGDASISADIARTELPIVRFCHAADEVVPLLLPLLSRGDVVVVKASRGVRAERVVEGLVAASKSASYAKESSREDLS